MKILWIVNSIFPAMSTHLGAKPNGGACSWMKTLLSYISMRSDLEIHVVNLSSFYKEDVSLITNRITYYGIRQPLFRQIFGANKKDLIKLKNLIKNVNPDVLHIFGTEYFFWLATEKLGIPSVVRIQGVLNSIVKWFFADITLRQVVRYPWMIFLWTSFYKRKFIEQYIISNAKYFECQTDYDIAWVKSMNPDAHCFRNVPILRKEFSEKSWTLANAKPYTITAVSSNAPYKGIHVLLKAFHILVKKYPNAILRLLGGIDNRGYGLLINDLITRFSLKENVINTGFLEASALSDEFSTSRVFVNPSFIENESLGRLEAMATGVPTVCAFSGGMPSVGGLHPAGLFFPPGDYALLAFYIEKIWTDDNYANEISQHQLSFMNNPIFNTDRIVEQTLKMYNNVIGISR